jgi:uncharacterized membrane protein
MKTTDFLDMLDADQITTAIRAAEAKTSGEIRVVVLRRRVADPIAAARREFARLRMHRTAERNGVLILIAPRSQSFAVFGDRGVHEKCGDAFWSGIAQQMSDACKAGRFTQALVQGIEKTGDLLAEHFPRRGDDRNELADEIVRG